MIEQRYAYINTTTSCHERINLAHGAIVVFGMFALYMLATDIGMPAYATIPIVIVLSFGFGVALYWIAVHRVIGQPELMSLLATFAANIILIGLGTVWWATSPYNVPVSLPGVTIEGRYTFTGTHIVAAVLAVAIAGLLYLLLYRTRIGKAMRAVASNREAAERRARGGIKRGLITLQKDRLSGGTAGREGSS